MIKFFINCNFLKIIILIFFIFICSCTKKEQKFDLKYIDSFYTLDSISCSPVDTLIRTSNALMYINFKEKQLVSEGLFNINVPEYATKYFNSSDFYFKLVKEKEKNANSIHEIELKEEAINLFFKDNNLDENDFRPTKSLTKGSEYKFYLVGKIKISSNYQSYLILNEKKYERGYTFNTLFLINIKEDFLKSILILSQHEMSRGDVVYRETKTNDEFFFSTLSLEYEFDDYIIENGYKKPKKNEIFYEVYKFDENGLVEIVINDESNMFRLSSFY